MNEIARGLDGRWLSSGNSAGRPIGSRHRLAEQFIRDAYELWKAEGPAALVQMRKEDNTKFCQMMAGLIPRDLVLSVEDNASTFAELPHHLDNLEQSEKWLAGSGNPGCPARPYDCVGSCYAGGYENSVKQPPKYLHPRRSFVMPFTQ